MGPTRLVVSDALGLFRAERTFPAERTLLVLPMVFPLRDVLQPPGFLPGGQVIRQVARGDHAARLRRARHTCPATRCGASIGPRRRARGQLIVKEFEQDPQAEVWIFLDAQQRAQARTAYETPAVPLESLLFTRRPKLSLPPDTLEYAISIAASLSNYFLGQKRSVGFVARDRAYAMITAERSERQQTKILETLAFMEGKGEESIAALVSAHAPLLPKGSSVILITPSLSEDLVLVTDDLQRRRLRPMVILLAAEGLEAGPARSN